MKATAIEAFEQDFQKTLKDSNGTQYTATQQGQVTVLTAKGITGYYFKETIPKDLIVLHFTCGYIKGDIGSLVEQDSSMSVPYVLARNGTVYRLYDHNMWSYHLGKGCVGGNGVCSKRSIPIEISNIGPLTLRGTNLLTAYGDVYCTLTDTQYYTKLPAPYRGFTYYASFTEAQYVSLNNLITSIRATNPTIPKTFLPVTAPAGKASRFNVFPDSATAAAFKGIATHVNFRVDGKVDIGPAFDWGRIGG